MGARLGDDFGVEFGIVEFYIFVRCDSYRCVFLFIFLVLFLGGFYVFGRLMFLGIGRKGNV